MKWSESVLISNEVKSTFAAARARRLAVLSLEVLRTLTSPQIPIFQEYLDALAESWFYRNCVLRSRWKYAS